MAASLTAYTYKPLSEPRTIRVIILEPALHIDDPIRCRLEDVSLDEQSDKALQYEALSYVWGERVGTRPIKCAGDTLRVTPNCELALRYLRLVSGERILWIDAICIDQTSTSEKAAQVPLMGDVYARSANVLVWLGPGSDETRKLFRHVNLAGHLTTLYDGIRSAWWRMFTLLPLVRWLWNHAYPGRGDQRQVLTVASNVWFCRIWTVQEAYLATNPVLVLGRSQCSFRAFYLYSQWSYNFATLPGPFTSRKVFLDFVSVAFGCGQSHRDTFRFLPYWLSHLRAFNAATDPRDTIYGILGIMASQWPDWPPFPVDYTITPALVYERFVKYVVRHTGVLNVLERNVSEVEPDVPLKGLPSWVPDMRCLPVGATISAINSKLVPLPALSLASSSSTVDIPILDQSRDGEIRLQGKVVDKVELVFHGKLPIDFSKTEGWKTVLVEAGRELSWWALEPIGGTNDTILSSLIEALGLSGAYVMFATKHKRAGVTPYDIQVGDDVVLMAGLDSPAILRARGAGTYTFIGRAAVEDLMRGQEWENEKHSVEIDTLVLV